eukprot:763867-Hanusia_phi.AAC.2
MERGSNLVPGSGADACGELKQGDELPTIDGVEVEGKSAADLAEHFHGPAGSTVILTLRRKESEEEEKDVNLEDEVVYRQCAHASRSTSEGIRKGADRLKKLRILWSFPTAPLSTSS